MKKRILIIEDSKRLSHLLRLFLERESYLIDIDDNGASGLHHAIFHHYDLIILNLFVAGKNGFAVLEELRKRKSTPVFTMSAVCGKQNETLSTRLGADEYFLMPFSPRDMVLKVRQLFSSHRPHLNKTPEINNRKNSDKENIITVLKTIEPEYGAYCDVRLSS